MKSLRLLFLLAFATLVLNCTSPSVYDPNDGMNSFSVSALETHIKTLASDEFSGRKPFTDGEKKTLDYLVDNFKKAGLAPGNGDSYLQEVPLVEITTKTDSVLTVNGRNKKISLTGLQDYVIWTQRVDQEEVKLDNEELVFAGFGIVAPEYNWNDYAGVDVKDKIVLVLVNDPGFGTGDSTFFKGNTMTYYGRWTYKFEEAARQGAKGCLIIHDDVPAGYGFWVLQNSWNTSKLYLDPGGKNEPTCSAYGWLSQPATKRLFEAANMNYAEALSRAHKTGSKAEQMNLRISTSMKVKTKYDKSYNVVGKVVGAKQPDEFIIYTSHWDHLGIGKPDVKGDSIYNGAHDNASGTAALVEIAKAFNSMKNKPNRSILFLAVTAEEQGLLGSAYYAQNPIYPREKTVANINMDEVNPFGKTKDIVVVGMGQSELEDYINDEARKMGRYVAPEPNPGAGHYFRSDHFNFAKAGIPALYVNEGVDHVEKGIDYGKQLISDYNSNRYHQPGDEYDASSWNLEGAIEDLKLLFQIGKRLSFETAWPQWKPGSEFKAVRESYRK